MIYHYRIRLGIATLNKIHSDGNDIDEKPKSIGKFKSESEAKEACKAHFEKVCKLASNTGRELPTMSFV